MSEAERPRNWFVRVEENINRRCQPGEKEDNFPRSATFRAINEVKWDHPKKGDTGNEKDKSQQEDL